MLLALGTHQFDITHRAVITAVVAPAPDLASDSSQARVVDSVVRRAESLVDAGADVLGLGGVEPDRGAHIGQEEELHLVVTAVEALHARFDQPVSVDTRRAAVVRASFAAGAVVGNDPTGFADPDYLGAAVDAGASVMVTDARTRPTSADPERVGADPISDVIRFLVDRARVAQQAGVPAERIVLDAGVGQDTSVSGSLELLRDHDRLARQGWPVSVSVPDDQGILDVNAAHALAISRGTRVLRVHDVRAARRVADVSARLLQAWERVNHHAMGAS